MTVDVCPSIHKYGNRIGGGGDFSSSGLETNFRGLYALRTSSYYIVAYCLHFCVVKFFSRFGLSVTKITKIEPTTKISCSTVLRMYM